MCVGENVSAQTGAPREWKKYNVTGERAKWCSHGKVYMSSYGVYIMDGREDMFWVVAAGSKRSTYMVCSAGALTV